MYFHCCFCYVGFTYSLNCGVFDKESHSKQQQLQQKVGMRPNCPKLNQNKSAFHWKIERNKLGEILFDLEKNRVSSYMQNYIGHDMNCELVNVLHKLRLLRKLMEFPRAAH